MSPRALVRGTRVYVRHPAASDREAFIAAAQGSRALHHPWVAAPDTDEAFDGFIQRSRRPSRSSLLVIGADDDALLGLYNLGEIVRGPFLNAYLGYYAFVPHAGKGWMRAAMPLVFQHAFDQLRLHRLQANVQPQNVASHALLAATGWREEGFAPRYLFIDGAWRDHVTYAITAEEVAGHTT